MEIKVFPGYLFWSYSQKADLPEELVAEHVILYGDLEDIFRLSDLVSHDIIAKVNQEIFNSGRWPKRSYFIKKVILGL
ncbi:MAG: hypothetical protein Q8M08_07785 [Bacteroidales bacterium]|nr:hypothetical protein [Bacteroidales bacterium]